MAQSKTEILSILQAAGMSPRHRFGQNFMIDQNLVRLIADAGQIIPTDTVIEIGPGTGTLTDELLSRAGKVVAVEIDRDLAGLLRQRFASNARFELIEGDALAGKHALEARLAATLRVAQKPIKLVANLPYNIASPLVIESLIAGVELLVFTVQKEVADRLRAQAGSEHYGPLTVMVQLLAEVEVLRTLPPQAFWPVPKVDSSLVRLTATPASSPCPDIRSLGKFVAGVFSSRRKTMRKALSQMDLDADRMLAEQNIDPKLRPEVLTPQQFRQMFESLAESERP